MSEEFEHGSSKAELPEVLRVIQDSPYRLSGVATQTRVQWAVPRTIQGSSSTAVTDLHTLAEGLMVDATRMVALLERPREAGREHARTDLVSMKSVVQAAAAVTGAFALFCGVGTFLSGTVLLHPVIALLLLSASVGFYTMSLVRRA